MKIPVFTTKESLIAWYEREIEAITNNGLRQAKEDLEKALNGEYRRAWMKFNNIDESNDEIWEQHLDWLRGNVKYLENKIKRYQRIISKNS
jgi:hypothetical protein